MLDMTLVIAPKSDQLNADDLLTAPRTIKITRVVGADSKEQPISIFFEGDNNKPYKPCLSMRRALVHVWGKNGLDYVGRSMTLYRDENVVFGGVKTGGIRISHMSHITESKVFALAANKASRKPYEVKPLKVENAAPDPQLDILKLNAQAAASNGIESLEAWWKELPKEAQAKIKPHMEEYKKLASTEQK